MVNADTIKGYVYQNKTYFNNPEKTSKISINEKNSHTNDPNKSNSFFRLSLLIPGLSLETRLTNSTSINVEIGTGFAIGQTTENGFSGLTIFYNKPSEIDYKNESYYRENYNRLYPFSKFEVRQYYNLLRRQNHYRNTKNNTASYFSLYSLIYLEDLYFIGPTWGMQRNVNRFYFNLNLGGGVYLWSDGSRMQPLIDLKFGLIIN
ncbi:MAG TPA: hypothetical protein VLN45_00530 [Ignavibacteriaceae bacterium]|nr:hypothetical protein [Ignavibacteriaceae bacterium]